MIFKYLFLVLALVPPLGCIDLNRHGGNSGNTGRRRNYPRNRDNANKATVSVAVILPHSMFKEREYKKKIYQASLALTSSNKQFSAKYTLKPYLDMLQPIPAPTEVLEKICDKFLANGTAVLLYLTDSENYGRHTMASQYFLQLAQYVRLPVVSWNADNSAFVEGAAGERLQLQLAPTIKHQAAAILSLLDRYGWHYFSIITGMIAGHGNFDQVLREMITANEDEARRGVDPTNKKTVIDSVTVKDPSDLSAVARTEARVFLLYSTHEEAVAILREAKRLGLTGKAYVWIVTQSVIGGDLDTPREFPVGMLGVHFKTDRSTMIDQIAPAMSVLGRALDTLATSSELSEEEKKTVGEINAKAFV